MWRLTGILFALVLCGCNDTAPPSPDSASTPVTQDETKNESSTPLQQPSKHARTGCPMEQLPAEFALGESARFINDMHPTECSSLLARGEHVAWVWRHYSSGGHVFFFACEQSAEDSSFPLERGEYSGHASDDLSETESYGNAVSVARVDAPGWSLVANPSFCGSYMAYWSLEDDATFASLFDLQNHQRLLRQRVVADQPATDFPGHFPPPEWSPDGSSVTFAPAEEKASPVRLSVP